MNRSRRPIVPLVRRPSSQVFLLSLLFLGLVCGPFCGLGCARLPGASERTTAIGRQSYALAGEGSPIVVFESGLGNGMETWRPVFESVAAMTRTLAYDRVGYGWSRKGRSRKDRSSSGESESGEGASDLAPRDGATVVRELRALLHALDLAPPYVLVGHSLGGQFVELFARLHPEEVAGVVLVDARHAEFSRRCIEQGVERCEMAWYQTWLMPAGARRELAAAASTEQQLRDAPAFPDVPVRVLTARRRPESMPRLRAVWAASQDDLVRLSPRGTQDVCRHCGHFIQREAPERVVEAIRSLVEPE